MPTALRIDPDTIKADDTKIQENDSVLVKLRHAADLARGKVDKANKKSFIVVLDEPVKRDDGRILYPAGTSLRVPRIAPGMAEIPTDGYVLLAPANTPIPREEAVTAPFPAYAPEAHGYVDQDGPPAKVAEFRPRGMVATLKEQALLTFLAARQRAQALQAELSSLQADISRQEAALTAAYEAGAMAPHGYRLALEVKRTPGKVSPAWKAEAIALAEKSGIPAETYEAEVRARTPKSPDTVTKSLVVERLG